ncbi:MAG: hypothetical protein RL095_2847 [Verrucomicrobiota bacterium]|jgi:fructose-specific component phosphotransferase system IIB-like protein
MKLSVEITALAAVLALGASSCMTPELTKTGRSGVEQLLISTSADRASAKAALPDFTGKKVAIDVSNLDAVDKPYVVLAVEAAVAKKGATLVAKAEEADLVVAIASGALATDQDSYLIGIPAIPIPIPGAGTVSTPELALLKKQTQTGVAKFAASIREVKAGKVQPLASSLGTSYMNRWKFLFIFSWSCSDIPEKPEAY